MTTEKEKDYSEARERFLTAVATLQNRTDAIDDLEEKTWGDIEILHHYANHIEDLFRD